MVLQAWDWKAVIRRNNLISPLIVGIQFLDPQYSLIKESQVFLLRINQGRDNQY